MIVRKMGKRSISAALTLSLLLTGACSFSVQAESADGEKKGVAAVEDSSAQTEAAGGEEKAVATAGETGVQTEAVKEEKKGLAAVTDKITGAADKVMQFLNDTGIAPALKQGYSTVTDFVFTYETQPDDPDMESLARSWAVTAWLGDNDKQETNVYYFDNHSLSMVEDPTMIGRGYNLKKTPEGSFLNGQYTGILKAVVTSPTTYTVEWVNYDDEVNMYLLQKMKEKKGTSDNTGEETAQTESAGE